MTSNEQLKCYPKLDSWSCLAMLESYVELISVTTRGLPNPKIEMMDLELQIPDSRATLLTTNATAVPKNTSQAEIFHSKVVRVMLRLASSQEIADIKFIRVKLIATSNLEIIWFNRFSIS